LSQDAEQFSRQYPGVRLHVVLANIAMLQFQELRDRNIELLIGRMPQPFVEDDLGPAVQKAYMRVDALDDLTVELQYQT
jgi:hypothetical protein